MGHSPFTSTATASRRKCCLRLPRFTARVASRTSRNNRQHSNHQSNPKLGMAHGDRREVILGNGSQELWLRRRQHQRDEIAFRLPRRNRPTSTVSAGRDQEITSIVGLRIAEKIDEAVRPRHDKTGRTGGIAGGEGLVPCIAIDRCGNRKPRLFTGAKIAAKNSHPGGPQGIELIFSHAFRRQADQDSAAAQSLQRTDGPAQVRGRPFLRRSPRDRGRCLPPRPRERPRPRAPSRRRGTPPPP